MVLSVDKRIKLLAILAGMGITHLYRRPSDVLWGRAAYWSCFPSADPGGRRARNIFLPLNITERPVLEEGIILISSRNMLVAR